MDRTQTIAQLRDTLAEVLDKEIPELTEETRLFEDLALDSTSVIEMLMVMEDTMGLEIDPEELEPEVFATVGSITDYVLSMSAAGAAS